MLLCFPEVNITHLQALNNRELARKQICNSPGQSLPVNKILPCLPYLTLLQSSGIPLTKCDEGALVAHVEVQSDPERI